MMTKEQYQQLIEKGEALMTKHRKEIEALGKKLGLEVKGTLESVVITDEHVVMSSSDSSYHCLCDMLASMVVCATEASGDISMNDMIKEIKKRAEHKGSKSPELRYKKVLECD